MTVPGIHHVQLARREARRTQYSVTNQRVIIEAGAFGRRTTEMALGDLPAFVGDRDDHVRDR